jgi:XRE family transcriptional regulator, aerobic/anaerobic benzoate catabolism transcriptional regulator
VQLHWLMSTPFVQFSASFREMSAAPDDLPASRPATGTPVDGADMAAPAFPDDDQFLQALGQRVRELRAQRAISRRVVARVSGVSERHLAHLEAGEGNISILLLRRVARALDVSLDDLLAPTTEDSARKQRIALIGLRGAGKSTLGRLLAEQMGVPFIELDREIERDAGMPIAELFSLYGQPGYRRVEKRVLERVVHEHDRAVLSVGGGIVSQSDSYDFLLASCQTVWLRAKPEEHMARVIEQGDLRPMAGHDEAMDDLRSILRAREPLYARADAIVDTAGEPVEASLAKLRQAVVG